jgi:hypothetical protein
VAKKLSGVVRVLVISFALLAVFAQASHAQNQVMGEVRFEAASKVEKTSGVWIDGQYVGYLNELKGDKKVLLLPGEHTVAARASGYQESEAKIVVEPGQIQILHVKLDRDPRVQYSSVTAEVKLSVAPDRAAVFVDDAYVGHVSEFQGVGRAMLLSPGKHHIKIALTGFQPFETEVDLQPKQKFEVKTDLVKGNITDSLVKGSK